MDNTRTYVVVGEDGNATKLAGSPEQSKGGAEAFLRQQARRGYLASLQGGVLTMISPLCDPTMSFEQVQEKYAEHGRRRRGSNTVFRNRTV